MNYRNDKHGEPISLLGYGCMRFTKKGKNIDLDKAEKELRTAIDAGVNYLDTAYIYPGSEVAVGEILARTGLRNKVNLATKLPGYMIKSEKSIEKHFQEQLSRLQTDHIDYYLMHMLTDLQSWNKLCDLGIKDWIREKKESGAIRNIGFSFHGNSDRFLQILNAYESDGPSAGVGGMGASLGNGSGEVLGSGVKKSMWDFCQIQYNYLDETTQAGVIGLRAAAEKGIPVIIMEPLRGGKLVDMLPEKARELIRNDPKKRTPAELALRWLWNQPEVTCVLSGMNSVEMVEENCRIASEAQAGEFTDEDFALIDGIRDSIREVTKVGCTGCGYCMPCPQGVDIPAAFRYYNETMISGKKSARFEYAQSVGIRKEKSFPTQCVACGKCESHCPQGISIINELKNANKALRPWYLKTGTAIARRFMLH